MDKLLRLIISVKNVALYIIIDSDLVDFIPSDNFFSMEPNETRIIEIEVIKTLKPGHNYSKQEIIDSFYVRSLYDIIK